MDNKIFAINPNGSLKWSFATAGKVFSSPAIGADGTVYVGSYDANLYAIGLDGSLKWRFSIPGGGLVHASPAVGRDGVVFVGGGADLYAVNPLRQKEVYRLPP